MKRLVLAAMILVAFSFAQNVFAQSELVLGLNRDFGYSGFDNKIEGLFTLTATGSDDLTSVDFYVDEVLIGSVGQSPFRLQFSTNSYSPGEHRLHAIGFTLSGQQLRSNEIVRVFLSKEESRGAVIGIIGPMLGIILLIMLAAAGIPALLGRKEKVGEYGILGGTVCPSCGLPFTLKFWSLNWFTGKLQRCPHCGKWSVVKRASPEALALSEARWRGDDQSSNPTDSDKERTRRQIDDSRYEK